MRNAMERWRWEGMGRWRFPAYFLALLMVIFGALRVVAWVWLVNVGPLGVGGWLRVFGTGMHRDLAAAWIVVLPFAVMAGLSGGETESRSWRRWVLGFVCGIWGVVFLFAAIAEGYFLEEFQSRFNPVAIDYLIYPHEVFTNIWESYPVAWIVWGCVGFGSLVGWGAVRVWARVLREESSWKLPGLWLTGAALLGVSVGSFSVRIHRDRGVNELANNTFVSAAAAIWTRHLEYGAFYLTMPRERAFERARRLVFANGDRAVGAADDLLREVPGETNRPRWNVVLLLEESLGSEFWGCLGRKGESLTPRLDEWATKRSWLFDSIYADGNRTIRGYEGVYASFPPLPGDSIVARDRTKGVETMAAALGRDGYATMFLYAGRGVFDGTGKFARENGWERFLELRDFERPAFTTAWGVCNEDLYDRALVEADRAFASGRPFFLTTMSVSNHRPYTYPPGRIAEDPQAKKREHVVKYSDFALGRFLDEAKRRPFWTNTLFLVVADHGARVYGSQTIPIKSYQIPMMITGGPVEGNPRRISTLGSQLDVGPTVLGMIGRPYRSTFFGHDLLRVGEHPFVLLHHNRSVGIYSDHRLVVFDLNRRVEYYTGDPTSGVMRRVERPDARLEEMRDDGVAMFQVADELYMDRRYRVPLETVGLRHGAP